MVDSRLTRKEPAEITYASPERCRVRTTTGYPRGLNSFLPWSDDSPTVKRASSTCRGVGITHTRRSKSPYPQREAPDVCSQTTPSRRQSLHRPWAHSSMTCVSYRCRPQLRHPGFPHILSNLLCLNPIPGDRYRDSVRVIHRARPRPRRKVCREPRPLPRAELAALRGVACSDVTPASCVEALLR